MLDENVSPAAYQPEFRAAGQPPCTLFNKNQAGCFKEKKKPIGSDNTPNINKEDALARRAVSLPHQNQNYHLSAMTPPSMVRRLLDMLPNIMISTFFAVTVQGSYTC
eukprot:1159036-Pelagomonas_calceolata.AAC.11